MLFRSREMMAFHRNRVLLRFGARWALALLLGGASLPAAHAQAGQSNKQAPAGSANQQAAPPDHSPPAVNPGRPTVTDPASLTAPGWLEAEWGTSKNLDRDRTLMTPLLLKLTARNGRVQYRLENDGYVRQGDGTEGIGDTNVALQYLFTSQERSGYDTSGRIALKIPTAPASIGTRKVDYGLLLLASRDFALYPDKSPRVHGDFNLGLSSLTRQAAPGTDTQFLVSASFTFPFKGTRWAYTNELVYFSPIQGQRAEVTTMHGLAYAAHRYAVYDIALQWQLHGDGAVFQVLAGATFFFSKLF